MVKNALLVAVGTIMAFFLCACDMHVDVGQVNVMLPDMHEQERISKYPVDGFCFGDCRNLGDSDIIFPDGDYGHVAGMQSARTLLEDIDVANDLDVLAERNGAIEIECITYMKDGTIDDTTVYKDADTYVVKGPWGIIVDEDGDVWCNYTEDGYPCHYVFLDNYDSFAEFNHYDAYIYNEDETPVSIEEENGLIHLYTEFPCDSFVANYGYDSGEIETLHEDYIIDASTLEILDSKMYVVDRAGNDNLVSEIILDREPEMCDMSAIDSGKSEDDIRHARIIAGGKEYTSTVAKGCGFRIWTGDNFEPGLYADKEYTIDLGPTDKYEDLEVYIKPVE